MTNASTTTTAATTSSATYSKTTTTTTTTTTARARKHFFHSPNKTSSVKKSIHEVLFFLLVCHSVCLLRGTSSIVRIPAFESKNFLLNFVKFCFLKCASARTQNKPWQG
jgi:hypothetical protein